MQKYGGAKSIAMAFLIFSQEKSAKSTLIHKSFHMTAFPFIRVSVHVRPILRPHFAKISQLSNFYSSI